MNALKAIRIKISIGDCWESPALHVLLTKEDGVVVARCLDFTVSSHGENEKDALKSLSDAIKEYVITSVEDSKLENLNDPAHSKYWRMFNELETRKLNQSFKRSLSKSILLKTPKKLAKLPISITYT